MYKEVLQSITGISIYPLISFVIFFLFFIALLVYVLVVNRQHISAMSMLPLLEDEPLKPVKSNPSC
ncbi:hypothetical protein I2I05_18125 [Hymenobacter sp. BT683]|uniref:CcoQ/FixQ family Cbb3-type cytochrome c oxidase assembly chaperone n=1 Tax=Hymenobacter jeongseonensis TaxID=2791027 RepID=A0ABS0INF7_9BACT|nr:hypothetical protein [Hymenobacter jeongseonensis]MBF9239315.1 hypothetical protein [Hymenobacter jeongseonensis]